MNKKYKNAFTLVELIVVITILSILWTIAFISLQWYSTDARDSTRLSDISSMKTSLELFHLDAWKYPNPTSWVNITYSWAVVWNQWTFWETVYTNTSKLDKIPLDPITDKEYTYSVITSQNEFELWWIMEGDEISMNNEKWIMNNVVSQTNAGEVEAIAYTTWNYNWTMAKSLSGSTCNVLSIPTIITNDTSVTDLQQIVTEKKLVYNKYKNLPSTFKWSKFKHDAWFDFTTNNLLAYSDASSCSPLTDTTSYTARVNLVKWLKDAYSWSIVQNEWEIKNISDLTIDTNNPSQDLLNYAASFVNNTLWAKLEISGNSVVSWWQTLDSNCNNPDISLWWQTWAWCNSTLWNGIEWWKQDNWIDWTITNCYPNYDWVSNTSNCNSYSTWMTSNYKANLWYIWNTTNWDTEVDNIWWKLYTWYNMDSACPSWRKVPTDNDWELLEDNLNKSKCRYTTTWFFCNWLWWFWHNLKTDDTNLVNFLKLPLAWQRNTDWTSFSSRWINTSLWTADSYHDTVQFIRKIILWNNTVWRQAGSKSFAYSVRCIKWEKTNTISSCTSTWQIINASTTYNWCSSPDIIVCSWPWLWYTLSACNVWSTVSGTWTSSYGKYFQWWNNWWTFSWTITPTTSLVDWSSYWPSNYYNNTNFIWWASMSTPYDWSSVKNDDLWWNNTNTKEAMQWPCEPWYHVPTQIEWSNLVNTWWWWTNGWQMMSDLKIANSWYRHRSDWVMYQMWDWNYVQYWASTPTWNDAYRLDVSPTDIKVYFSMNRSFWLPIRCFKN